MTISRSDMPFFREKCGGAAPVRAKRGLPRGIFGQKKGAALALVLTATAAFAQEVAVPSGVPMRLYEVILEENPPVARFRFVSDAIDPAGEGRGFVDLVDDLQFLCEQVVVPSLAANNWTAEEVVLSVGSRETEFGIFEDGVTQFFQPYTVQDGACEWSEF